MSTIHEANTVNKNNIVSLGKNNKELKKVKFKLTLIPSLLVIVIISLLGMGYFYYRYNTLKNNPNQETQQEVKDTLGKLGKLMVLPTDDIPTIATVYDRTKLTSQAFFANAQNGDKLIIYAKTKKAILFREKDNKIVEVAPIYFDNSRTNNTTTAN